MNIYICDKIVTEKKAKTMTIPILISYQKIVFLRTRNKK